MAKLSVAFLWHMHQPNYKDPLRGYYAMPWVRLHATKAYYDMAALARRYPAMKLTFNLVPALLEQLEDYAAGAEDFESRLSEINPVDLATDEKEAILSRFFQANTDTMIRPFNRYMELLQMRGERGTRSDITRALDRFAAQDYLDLQVLFNLSWFGFTAREESDDIRRLIRKGRYYTIEDRDLVLERQRSIIAAIIPLYREIWESGAAEITASPFYHPILPLLCDTSIARAGMPDCLLPKHRFASPEDAARQVNMTLEFWENRFGRRPEGMWPSEGSVSHDALDTIHTAGLKWVATDEEILARSKPDYNRATDLYQPWSANGLSIFFRDHRLSDQIGFVYSRNPAHVAVDDFMTRLHEIAENGSGDRIVPIILDGENPWECFPGSGQEFLELLYQRIIDDKIIKPVSFSEYLRKHPPEEALDSIFPGSWIDGNFGTWMGDQEEADGWDALKNARDTLVKADTELAPDARIEAWTELFRAEGSDWFWWYGEDHTSPNDPEFDRLFRAHLERIYQIIGVQAPPEVTEPIIKKTLIQPDSEPTGLMTPEIDGNITTFYEWVSAGWLPTLGPAGVMSGSGPILSDIYYGFDLSSLYLRFDFTVREEPLDRRMYRISVIIDDGDRYRLDIDLAAPESYILYRRIQDRWVRRSRKNTVAMDRIVEAGVPFDAIGATAGVRIGFNVLVLEKDVECERWPLTGQVSFVVPDERFQSMMWQV